MDWRMIQFIPYLADGRAKLGGKLTHVGLLPGIEKEAHQDTDAHFRGD